MNQPEPMHHYGDDRLVERLAVALHAAGLQEKPLTAEDLAPLDQFHARGLAATVQLGNALELKHSDAVIDIGSGLGGPSRYLAQRFGCHVSGVDISPGFVEAATFLAERAGVSHRVDYRWGNALSLPFTDGSFDVAWTQHVAMNVADRDGFYAEAHRVLRPGGRFAIYDVVSRDGMEVLYPVPWSRTPENSFLLTADGMLGAVERAGFDVTLWEDHSQEAVAWFDELAAARQPGPPPKIGLHLAMGPRWPDMAANLARNLREGRAGLVQVILTRQP